MNALRDIEYFMKGILCLVLSDNTTWCKWDPKIVSEGEGSTMQLQMTLQFTPRLTDDTATCRWLEEVCRNKLFSVELV